MAALFGTSVPHILVRPYLLQPATCKACGQQVQRWVYVFHVCLSACVSPLITCATYIDFYTHTTLILCSLHEWFVGTTNMYVYSCIARAHNSSGRTVSLLAFCSGILSHLPSPLPPYHHTLIAEFNKMKDELPDAYKNKDAKPETKEKEQTPVTEKVLLHITSVTQEYVCVGL